MSCHTTNPASPDQGFAVVPRLARHQAVRSRAGDQIPHVERRQVLHRVDHRFDPTAGSDHAPRDDGRSPRAHRAAPPGRRTAAQQPQRRRVDAVGAGQSGGCRCGGHGDHIGRPTGPGERSPLIGGRIGRHMVKHDDRRHADHLNHVEQPVARCCRVNPVRESVVIDTVMDDRHVALVQLAGDGGERAGRPRETLGWASTGAGVVEAIRAISCRCCSESARAVAKRVADEVRESQELTTPYRRRRVLDTNRLTGIAASSTRLRSRRRACTGRQRNRPSCPSERLSQEEDFILPAS